jgi:hypothetical protein
VHPRRGARRGRPPVDDRRGGAGAGDREAVGDVEVAGVGEILIQGRDLERVCARRDDDRVGAGQRIRLLDRRTQGACSGTRVARAVADLGVQKVARVVDDELDAGGAGRLQADDEGAKERDRKSGGRASPASSCRMGM